MSISLFYSKPARTMMMMAVPVILVTQYARFSSYNIISQALVYMAIAYNAECLNEGGCKLWSWISVLLPIVYSLMDIFFGGMLGLKALPPSPITNIIPIKRINNDSVYTAVATAASNTFSSGEPVANSAQPSVTTGNIAEPFYI